MERGPRFEGRASYHRRRRSRGQSLVEFALVAPILLVLLGGIVQFGVIFAAKNTLTQIARDTARWAATQTTSPCDAQTTASAPQPVSKADQIATASSLIGYSSGTWGSGTFSHSMGQSAALASPPPSGEAVEAVWSWDVGGVCPPADNTVPVYVTIRVTHDAPVLLPGIQYLPVLGTCDATGCHISLSATSTFRMEPPRNG